MLQVSTGHACRIIGGGNDLPLRQTPVHIHTRLTGRLPEGLLPLSLLHQSTLFFQFLGTLSPHLENAGIVLLLGQRTQE